MSPELDICFFCHKPIETNAYQIEGKWLHKKNCLEKASGLKLEKLLERKLTEGEMSAYSDGTKHWFKNGKRHRDNDKPAAIYTNGTKCWYKNGKCHRDNDKPAIIRSDGTKYWFKDGECHRDNDRPAITYANGSKYWYKNDKEYCPKEAK